MVAHLFCVSALDLATIGYLFLKCRYHIIFLHTLWKASIPIKVCTKKMHTVLGWYAIKKGERSLIAHLYMYVTFRGYHLPVCKINLHTTFDHPNTPAIFSGVQLIFACNFMAPEWLDYATILWYMHGSLKWYTKKGVIKGNHNISLHSILYIKSALHN